VTDDSDDQLLARVLAGETQLYARLVDRYRDRLGRFALRMLGNRADAEDALQDTFVRAYRALGNCHRGEGEGKGFGPWVFGILVNRCRTYASRRARVEALMVVDDAAVASAAVGPNEAGETLREAIGWALGRLPPEQREAFLLKHVEDLSYEAMETMTGVRSATLRMRVFRAREELRKLLGEVVND
jgi:RNA polymerase sigma-70 factor (ECF subfamily)